MDRLTRIDFFLLETFWVYVRKLLISGKNKLAYRILDLICQRDLYRCTYQSDLSLVLEIECEEIVDK